ncbi:MULTISPECIES: 50S ribosomal protein L25 [Thermoactinomyces]|jgi:large subunit ribosomal protein L25|uniref:Large ribosomal subunit protein bL25 n=1 Tax=Thermoactinomyces daqus TaxID=1329516 RepID=A0A7W2AH98_9BACL|nr:MULTISPECIES: 50S ribosomal protein L25 [Thermoactinomyces]MBA4542446.1 50S ribosomal protein L25 [Thermoactinomyces daqus]MBH8598765.1 50S ribosomal protein L25 [Thermoactinomyces sp. CICC 10523]MBH8604750.1 50S ribosomal protein L25 [Thermoactinomyces sp. CICC 10522]MBH8607424.1 50S ribosomal protein L25 [Thermoactinomyces sp. CICC 10521]
MSVAITAEKRERTTQGYINRLRREGRIPAVLYGKDFSPELIHVAESEVRKLGARGFADLRLEGKAYRVMVRDIQRDPVKDRLLHIDFFKVEKNRPIDAEVPLVLTGEAPGAKAGGIVEQHLRTVEVRTLPDRLPQELTLDISGLEMGDSLSLNHLHLPEGVELLADPEAVVVSIVPPQAGEVSQEAEEENEKENE